MIVTEKNVSDALAYLAIDPHPLAEAQWAMNNAENKSKEVYARCFLDADGSVEARKASAEIAPEHIAAKAAEAEAIKQLTRCRSRVKAAENLIEVWRSENANARAAERIR